MRILLANDDGVHAPGLRALYLALAPIADVIIVAPESERSGYSSAITLDSPLRAIEIEPNIWAVNGTPADCVYLANQGLFDVPFDLVVSGINSGANLSDDTVYSGTVGAAFEGRFLAQAALAVSFVGEKVKQYQSAKDYQLAAAWVRDFIQAGIPKLPPFHIYNINIPDLPVLKGQRLTALGRRNQPGQVHTTANPRGRQVHWLGLAHHHVQSAEVHDFCDFEAVEQGFVSITPLKMDRTNRDLFAELESDLSQDFQS